MERHPKLSVSKASNLAKHRTLLTKDDIIDWFTKIEAYFEDHNLKDVISDPSRVWNCDESSFKVCPTPRAVYGPKNKRVYHITANDEKECYSVMLTVSATGKLAPSLVIYPYEKRIPYEIARVSQRLGHGSFWFWISNCKDINGFYFGFFSSLPRINKGQISGHFVFGRT